MRKEKGITLVALVMTIIILIILAGISISTLIGENGIIVKAKEAKQNMVLAGEAEALQLNQLYYELENGGELTEDEESSKKDEIIALLQQQVGELQTELESLREQVSQKDIEITDLKTQITEKQEQISNLQSQLDSLNSLIAQTNATADKILAGYKAYSGGQLLTGTMANRGAVSSSLNCGASYIIPAGYHSGSGKVTANSLASQTVATATAADIARGKTAWVNGVKITGNSVNNIENIVPVVYRQKDSFSATVGKKYLIFAVSTLYNGEVKTTLTGADILSYSGVCGGPNNGGSVGTGIMIICKATSSIITFTGGNDAVLTGLIVLPID